MPCAVLVCFLFSLEVKPPFFIGWFTNHHYFSRGLSSSKEPPIFLMVAHIQGFPKEKNKSNSIFPWNQDWCVREKLGDLRVKQTQSRRWFQYFLNIFCSSLLGEMIRFRYFSDGLKPPTRNFVKYLFHSGKTFGDHNIFDSKIQFELVFLCPKWLRKKGYHPESYHGTWKSGFPKGMSFSRGPFLGSIC